MTPSLFSQLWNDWIRDVRRQKMNIADAATQMGFSEFTLCEVELGRRLFSQDELTRFLKIVGESVPEGLEIPLETDPKKLLRRQKTMIGLQRHHQLLGNTRGGDVTEVEVQSKIDMVRKIANEQASALTADAATKIRRYLEIKKLLQRVELMKVELTTLSQELYDLDQRIPGCLPTEIAEDLNDFIFTKQLHQAKNGKTVSLEDADARLK
jgi:biopolymer transport protein ExbD